MLTRSLAEAPFLYYGVLSPHVGLRDRWFFPLWVAPFGLAFAALARTRRDLRNLALIVGVGVVVLAAGPLVRIAVYQAQHPVQALLRLLRAEFLRELKQRGFVISDQARAPYSDSE